MIPSCWKTNCIDKIKVEKVRLENWIRKAKRIKNNRLFQENEGLFYRRMEDDIEKKGEIPDISKFTEFWAGIWERKKSQNNLGC